MRITWLGHSTALIELDGVRLLTDPLLRGWVGHLRRCGPVPSVALDDVDAVLISHVHHDHLDLPSLSRIGRTVRFVVPKGAGSLVRRRGFRNVTEVVEGDETAIGAVTVRATHADHDAGRGPLGVTAPSLGYVVSGTASAYFAGDTDLFDGMADLAPHLDLALLPVAGWGPRLPAGHLSAETAVQALGLLRPAVAVPVHWGTYQRVGMGLDAATMREPADAFARLAAELDPPVSVHVLPVGGSLEVAPAGSGPAAGG